MASLSAVMVVRVALEATESSTAFSCVTAAAMLSRWLLSSERDGSWVVAAVPAKRIGPVVEMPWMAMAVEALPKESPWLPVALCSRLTVFWDLRAQCFQAVQVLSWGETVPLVS